MGCGYRKVQTAVKEQVVFIYNNITMVSFQSLSPKRLLLSGIIVIALGSVLGWYALPQLIHYQIATNINLQPGTELREMWSNFPDPVGFKLYLFNVTNPTEIQKGEKPALREVGPYVYDEYKQKAELLDHEEDDSISFNNRDTWFFNKQKSGELTGDEIVTIPHLLVLGMVLSAEKDMAVMLPAIIRAIPFIFGTSESVFLTASVKDILFDGILINCTLKDFTARMLCVLMKTQGKDLQKVGKNAFKFSFFGGKNGTLQERLRLKRGIQKVTDVGRVVAYKDQPRMAVWSGPKCNEYAGTDGSIFPPFLQDSTSILAYAPDLCRSLDAKYVGPTVYKGVKGRIYSADFGDMSNDPELRCFCTTRKSCLKRGVHDLTRCTGAPLVASLPHFYRAHEDYLDAVTGLHPQQALHETSLHFEPITGTPMLGYKRLQFNIKVHPVSKFAPMKDLRAMLFPVLWVDEGLELEDKYMGQLKNIFMIFSIIDIVKWIIISAGGILSAAGVYLLVRKLTNNAAAVLGRNSPEVVPLDLETPPRY